MTTNSVENIVKLAACICAQDGIISQTELDFMQKNVQVFNKIEFVDSFFK